MKWALRKWLRNRFNQGGTTWAVTPILEVVLTELRCAYPEDNLPTSRQSIMDAMELIDILSVLDRSKETNNE
jgi:hypothetical protein